MMRWVSALLVLVSASAVRAEGVVIDHKAVGCMVAGKHPRLAACFSPAPDLARARVYFRADGSPHWYFVAMASDAPCFVGTLPKPKAETKKIVYYIQALDRQFAETRTPDAAPEIVGHAGECRTVPVAAYSDKAAVSVNAVAGSPLVPAGFVVAGAVLFANMTQ